VEHLLARTSRTFALSIPLLPEPARTEVTTAYLLFRIADTFEDATAWPGARRREALSDFTRLLETSGRGASVNGAASAHARAWIASPPVSHEGYLDLLRETPRVLASLAGLKPAARAAICRHLGRTTLGMARYVEGAQNGQVLAIADLPGLQDYCYVVAGIVGEMLTELFLLAEPALDPLGPTLAPRARHFGEGLQLTNILKDASDDATEGRRYLPRGVDRAAVIALAREDLRRAEEYVRALQEGGASRGLVAFTALPVLLAFATLDRVEEHGPGAKVSRSDVAALLERMNQALDEGSPVVGGAATGVP
jgi:farnesyl-diphosphate farnesyltransferase